MAPNNVAVKYAVCVESFETKYSRMDQVKFVETVFKKFTNFTWSILEYFVPFTFW